MGNIKIKKALHDEADYIVITDKKLASYIIIIKSASKPALTAAMASAVVAATMWWNLLGWSLGLYAAGETSAIIFLLAILGAALLLALHKDYEI